MKKKSLAAILLLLLATAVIAGVYLSGRKQAAEGTVAVVYADKETLVDPFRAPAADVAGTVVNGKGKEKEVSGTGVTLMSVLELAGIRAGSFSSARVVSSDEYAAELSADEAAADGTAFLIRDQADDGSTAVRLVVFGDTNAKRQVKNVVRIEVSK